MEPDGRSREELSTLLSKCVRTNDIAGLLEDGSVWLLLSQAGPNDLKFILPRFELQGLSVRVENVPDQPASAADRTEALPVPETEPPTQRNSAVDWYPQEARTPETAGSGAKS